MLRALRHTLRFAIGIAAVALGALATGAGCGPTQHEIWVCLNPATGKEDPSIYDANHYVSGKFDPCHCYDPCGEAETCPILVDAGHLDCDAGTDDAGGT